MSNPITRRFALFRIASAGTAAAIAGVPLAIAAVQPKSPESADLIRLGDEFIAQTKVWQACETARVTAKAECDRLWPRVPEELYLINAGLWLDCEAERDCEGKTISRIVEGRQFPLFVDYVSAKILQDALVQLKGSKALYARYRRKRIKLLLPAATAYDAALKAALEASDYWAKVEAVGAADSRLDDLKRQLADTPALTPLGITIKAQAYQACVALGKEGTFQAAIHLGPSIAADICRVLSEGDEP